MLARSQKLPAQESDCLLEPQNIQQNLPSMSMGIKLENNRCLTQKFNIFKNSMYTYSEHADDKKNKHTCLV